MTSCRYHLVAVVFGLLATAAVASRGEEKKQRMNVAISVGSNSMPASAQGPSPDSSMGSGQRQDRPAESPTLSKDPQVETIAQALEDTAAASFVGTASVPDLRSKYAHFRTLVIMGMVLFAFGRQIWSAVRELRLKTSMMKISEEEFAAAAARADAAAAPIRPRDFAARSAAGDAARAERRAATTPTMPTAVPSEVPATTAAEPSAPEAPVQRAGPALRPEAGRRSHSAPPQGRDEVSETSRRACQTAPSTPRAAAPARAAV